MKTIKICTLILAAAVFAASCGESTPAPGSATTSKTAAPVTDVSVAQPQAAAEDDNSAMAKELYALNCMICHKESGKGGKVTIEGKVLEPDDLTKDSLKKATDDKLIGYVTNGIPDEGMPAFVDKLSPEEIKTVISHVRELQK